MFGHPENRSRFECKAPRRGPWVVLTLAAVFTALMPSALAQRHGRSGVEVVNGVCAECHARPGQQAPQVGDVKAWAPRAAQGLGALTEHAMNGIRNMPAHGGSAWLSDIEIERAIIHMVNHSGGRWIEPVDGSTPAVLRSHQQVVQMHCSRCHREGVDGAPRMGDRAAWIPRLRNGLDAAVRSAVHGHGAMPSRGGVADLSDTEIRDAVAYMFNYGVTLAAPTPVSSASSGANPFHRVAGGADVYLGVVRADAMRPGSRRGVIPDGKDVYHLNISLYDARTKLPIGDAEVRVKVSDPMGAETRTLDTFAVNRVVSYGSYFRMSGPSAYTITAMIQRPGEAGVSAARFEYRVQ